MADRPPSDARAARPPAIAIAPPEPIPPELATAPIPFPPALAAPPASGNADLAPAPDSTTAEKPRVRGRPFAPGNPGGGRRKKSAAWKAEMRRGAEWAPRILYTQMMDRRTPAEVRRKAAEFFIVWQYGRPVAALSNPDGSPLIPAGMPADNPLTLLLARLVASRNGASTTTSPTSPNDDSAPPGANGAATEGKAS